MPAFFIRSRMPQKWRFIDAWAIARRGIKGASFPAWSKQWSLPDAAPDSETGCHLTWPGAASMSVALRSKKSAFPQHNEQLVHQGDIFRSRSLPQQSNDKLPLWHNFM